MYLLASSSFLLHAAAIDLTSDFAATVNNFWSTPGNWSNGIPNNGTPPNTVYTAIIGAPGSPQSAFLDVPEIIGGLNVRSGSSLVFAPSGTLTLGDSNSVGTLTNAGIVDLSHGPLTIDSSVGTAGTFNASTNTGILNLHNGTLVINDAGTDVGTALAGGGTIRLNAGTIQGQTGDERFAVQGTIQGAGTISNLTLEPVSGKSLLIDESPLTGQSGSLAIGANTTLTTNGGNLVLVGSNQATSLVNQGTVNIGAGGSFTFRGDGTPAGVFNIENGAVIRIANGTLLLDANGASGTFEISGASAPGTLSLAGGTITSQTGTVTLINNSNNTLIGNGTISNSAAFANTGSVIADNGTLLLRNPVDYNSTTQTLSGSGTYAADKAAILQFGHMPAGTGIATNDGKVVLIGTGEFENAAGQDALSGFLSANNGTLTLRNGATLALTNAFANNGNLNVSAASKLDLTGGGFLNVDAGGSLNGGAYTIGGTLRYSGADITAIGAATSLTMEGSGLIVNTNGSAHNALIQSLNANNGTLTLQNSAQLSLQQAFTNNGNLNVLAGSTLNLKPGGFSNISGGLLDGGTYNIGGILIYSGQNITGITSSANLTLDGSGIIVNATGSNHNALSHSLTINAGTLTLQDGADLALARRFDNLGNLNVLANSTLDLTAGGFSNVKGQGVLNEGTYAIGGTLIYNGQAIQKIGSTASLALEGNGSIVNGANQNQLANSLTTNNGIFILKSGADLALSQIFTNHGTLNVGSGSTLDLTSGGFANVSGNGVLKGGTYMIGGAVLYNGHNIVAVGGQASLTLDGTGVIYNASAGDAVSATLTHNNGTLVLQNGAALSPAGTFTNMGSVDVESGSILKAGLIANFGQMTIAGSAAPGSAQTMLWSAAVSANGVSNHGIVVIGGGDQSGEPSLTVENGNYTQTAGFTEVDGLLTASEADVQGGTLFGTGTIDGTLLNEGGTVAPGDAPGVLSVSDYTQTAGTLLFDIAGTRAGVDYSQLRITNAAAFGGDIEFDFLNGFTPQSDQLYTLILFGSSAGQFSGYTIDNLPDGYTANITYGASDLQVSFQTATPEPASAALMFLGVGLMGLAARRRIHCRGSR